MTAALLCAKPKTLATSASSLPPSLTPSESVESYVACDGLDPTEATAYALVYATLHCCVAMSMTSHTYRKSSEKGGGGRGRGARAGIRLGVLGT